MPGGLSLLVQRMTEVETLVGDRFYSYETFTVENLATQVTSVRRIYQIPVLWAGILHSLQGYDVLQNDQIKLLATTVNNMVLAHGQGYHGITAFKKAMDISPDSQKAASNYYHTKIQEIWEKDFNNPEIADQKTSFRNPDSAARMNAFEATNALLNCQKFIVDNDIPGLEEKQLHHKMNKHTEVISEGTRSQTDRVRRLANF